MSFVTPNAYLVFHLYASGVENGPVVHSVIILDATVLDRSTGPDSTDCDVLRCKAKRTLVIRDYGGSNSNFLFEITISPMFCIY